MTSSRAAVFLDRDGVLNRAVVKNGRPHPPQTPSEFELLPGTADAVRRLKGAGFCLVVVTNQPDVSRGTQRQDVIETMHGILARQLPLDEILVCFHDDADDCDCRKPQPGLLLKAAQKWDIDLRRSFMVGDRWKDTEAGRRAGCKTVFIDYKYDEPMKATPDHIVTSLGSAVDWILNEDVKTKVKR